MNPPEDGQRPWALAWKNLTYHVTTFEGYRPRAKAILHGLSGHFTVGTLNAFLGPSGAGKTTLLNCLSGRGPSNPLSSLSPTSVILFGPRVVSPSTSFFIPQHIHECTVNEMSVNSILDYAFAFKNRRSLTAAQREAHKRAIMEELMLEEGVLGTAFGKCSGGEQKRIAIAQELMFVDSKPDFLFLDEPTTGLDSSAAYQVVACLAGLARRHGVTVIVSIHVPSSETLALFDRLYVLAKGGRCLYSGRPSALTHYLHDNQVTDAIEAEAQVTPQPSIERLIDLACQPEGSQAIHALSECQIQREASALAQINLSTLAPAKWRQSKGFSLSSLLLQIRRIGQIVFHSHLKAFLFMLFLLVLYVLILSSLSVKHTPMWRSSGCLPVAGYNGSCLQSLAEGHLVRENVNYQVYLLIYSGLVVSCAAAFWYHSMLKILQNEHGNAWYSLSTFFLASQLIALFEITIFALLTSTLAYYLSGNSEIDPSGLNWNRLTRYTLTLWSFTVYMQSIGQLVGVLFLEHLDFAMVTSIIVNSFLWLFNGVLIDVERTTNLLISLGATLLGVKYSSYGLLHAIFQLDRCDPLKDFSIIVNLYHLEEYTLFHYFLRPLLNSLLLRLATYAFLMIKFKASFGHLLPSLTRWLKAPSQPLAGPREEESTKLVVTQEAGPERDMRHLSGAIALAWRHVHLRRTTYLSESVSIDASSQEEEDEESCILRNVSGQVTFGSLTALMGPSGAGKTSLLKVLNGRCKSRLSTKAAFYLSRLAPIRTCFVAQEVSHHLLDGLTARQLLLYASKLKNVSSLQKVDHAFVVDRLLGELALTGVANTPVSACSGGERKRLALAAELTSTAMPNLVILDEPTSGLDSTSAELLPSTLRRLSRAHALAIIVSAHQPTTKCLPLFDQLYVLARGGILIYAGAPSCIRETLTRLPGLTLAAPTLTPAAPILAPAAPTQPAIEALITLSCSSWRDPLVQQLVHQTRSVLPYLETALRASTVPSPDGVSSPRVRFTASSLTLLLSRYLTLIFSHTWTEWFFFTLVYQGYITSMYLFFSTRMLTFSGCISLAESDVACAWGVSLSKQVEHYSLLENFKYNFFYTVVFMAFLLGQFTFNFFRALPYFRAEHRNGWYSTGAWYLVKSATDLALSALSLALYVHLGNWMGAIRPGVYPHLLGVFFLTTAAIQGLAHTVALASRGHFATLAFTTILLAVFFNLLSNFMIFNYRLHYVYQAVSLLVPTRFLFETVMLLQYGFGRCAPDETQQLLYGMRLTDGDFSGRIALLIGNALLYHGLCLYLLLRSADQEECRRERNREMAQFHSKVRKVSSPIGGETP